MSLSRGKPLLGIFSITVFILTTLFLLFVPQYLDVHREFNINLYAALISLFNVSILLGWMAFGEYGGIPFTILSAVISLWMIVKADFYRGSLFTVPFFAVSFLGYAYWKMQGNIEQEYTLKDERLGEELNLLANSIDKSRGYIKSLEEKLARYSMLKEVAETLSSDLSLESVNELIAEKALSTIGKPGRLQLFLVDIKKQELMLTVSRDAEKIKTKKGDVFDHAVLRQRKPLIIEDITKDFRFSSDDIEEAAKHFRSLIEAPLVGENKVIGILRMDSPNDSLYTHDDLRLLDVIANLGAVAMQNAILYARTQELAIKDGLTGLAVRRYFMERLQEELKRAARKKGVLSLLILDIDHFKDYNDRYGHTAGDLVLKYLARRIGSMIREGDILARYGGEEIALLLLGADKAAAAKEAELIRKYIEKEQLVIRRHKANVTVSVGVASYPKDAIAEEELIKIADERLYKAKADGRNRVCVS